MATTKVITRRGLFFGAAAFAVAGIAIPERVQAEARRMGKYCMSCNWESQWIDGVTGAAHPEQGGMVPFVGGWQLGPGMNTFAGGTMLSASGPSLVFAVSVTHLVQNSNGAEFAMVGHWAPGGTKDVDDIVRVVGSGENTHYFAEGYPMLFRPGEWFDCHFQANAGSQNRASVTVYHAPLGEDR